MANNCSDLIWMHLRVDSTVYSCSDRERGGERDEKKRERKQGEGEEGSNHLPKTLFSHLAGCRLSDTLRVLCFQRWVSPLGRVPAVECIIPKNGPSAAALAPKTGLTGQLVVHYPRPSRPTGTEFVPHTPTPVPEMRLPCWANQRYQVLWSAMKSFMGHAFVVAPIANKDHGELCQCPTECLIPWAGDKTGSARISLCGTILNIPCSNRLIVGWGEGGEHLNYSRNLKSHFKAKFHGL